MFTKEYGYNKEYGYYSDAYIYAYYYGKYNA